MKKLGFVFAIIFAVFLTQSCQKDLELDPNEGQEAPELPSEETFLMSMVPFTELDEGLTDPDEAGNRTIGNWGHSAANVLVWNTILTAHLSIPVLSFYESFNHQPVYQGQGIWLWAYQVSDNTATYQAELYGELLANNEVKWDMFVSKVGGFSQIHWYSGIVAFDHSYANWTLYHDPYNPKPFISINYLKDNGNGVASIRYTNIIPAVPENGGYIEYRTGSVVPGEFDRAYDVFNAGIDNLLEINWNSMDKKGRVKDPKHFQDEKWHCWDTQVQDVDC